MLWLLAAVLAWHLAILTAGCWLLAAVWFAFFLLLASGMLSLLAAGCAGC
jgi:hypothetical protein